jgi:hypothetical protein
MSGHMISTEAAEAAYQAAIVTKSDGAREYNAAHLSSMRNCLSFPPALPKNHDFVCTHRIGNCVEGGKGAH